MQRPSAHPVLRSSLTLLGLALVSLAMTWPLARQMGDHVVSATYFWDAYTNTMLMGSRARTVLGIGPGSFYEDYFFAPLPNSIAFNENLFGLSLLFLPIYALTHSPLFAYNAVLLLSLTLSAYFMSRLVRELSGSEPAGLLSGVAFAFCPYALFEIGRIQLVATQWIPLFFLGLHRSARRKRPRDLLLACTAYALQVGTCLYYAMFMLPLAGLLAVLLFVRHRPFPRRLGLWALGAAVPTAGVILAMVFPYFATRKTFSLVRSEDFAQDFDGKLAFLLHVHPTNRLLTFLHHLPATEEGAHEEIAFPGFTLIAFALVALGFGVMAAIRRSGSARVLLGLPAYALASCIALSAAALLTHSMLWPLLLFPVVVLGWSRLAPGAAPLTGDAAAWFFLLLLALALFVGFVPFVYHGAPVHGLYYYLHGYVPGFNGIRKVSRQAVMIALGFAVLGGYGAAELLGRVRNAWARGVVTSALACGLMLELWNAPLALTLVPAAGTVPPAYRFIARQPGHRRIAVIPTSWGMERFVGQRGLAIHNYLALFHGRRTLNGKSSWIPPVTQLYNRVTRSLPSEAALRIVEILRPEFLVVHGGDIWPGSFAAITAALEQHSDAFRRVFREGQDSVYALLPSRDSTLGLLPTPAIDGSRYEPVDRRQTAITANRFNRQARLAIDGNPLSKWTTGRPQAAGDSFELTLAEPRMVAALDLSDYQLTFDAPAAFKLEVSEDGASYRTVFERPRIRLYYAQIYKPDHFLFRVVLPQPVRARRVRLTLLEGIPWRYFTIYEARLWAEKRRPPG